MLKIHGRISACLIPGFILAILLSVFIQNANACSYDTPGCIANCHTRYDADITAATLDLTAKQAAQTTAQEALDAATARLNASLARAAVVEAKMGAEDARHIGVLTAIAAGYATAIRSCGVNIYCQGIAQTVAQAALATEASLTTANVRLITLELEAALADVRIAQTAHQHAIDALAAARAAVVAAQERLIALLRGLNDCLGLCTPCQRTEY